MIYILKYDYIGTGAEHDIPSIALHIINKQI